MSAVPSADSSAAAPASAPATCAIGVPSKDYDELKRLVREGRHTKTRPLRFKFAGDDFKTLIWSEGDKLIGRDPLHPEGREIHITHPQHFATGEFKPESAKGLLLNAHCQVWGEDDYAVMLPFLMMFKKKLDDITEAMDFVKAQPASDKKTRATMMLVGVLCEIVWIINCTMMKPGYPTGSMLKVIEHTSKVEELVKAYVA